MMRLRRPSATIVLALMAIVAVAQHVTACTGITLIAKDGAVVFGRTLEWGTFDLKSRLVLVPRGHEYQSHLGDKLVGRVWKTVYGAVGLDVLEKDHLVDGMNEQGLAVNVFYHPGFAEYAKLDPSKAATTIETLDLCQYLLTTCATVAEVRRALAEVTVVGVLEPAIGIAPPIHLIVTERGGKAIVVEFTQGKTTVHDAPLGVITNAPNYDWHMINLRNYLNLSPVALPDKQIDELDFRPLGGGSGMIGLPGDFTPPSRFVRAVAFAKSARPTDTGAETMYELLRILDNFNLPLGAAEGEGAGNTKGMRSATIWTTGYDTKNLVMQYHTQHNRRVRQVDLKKIDFAGLRDLVRLPLDKQKSQDIEDVTPLKE
ncbi:MAG: choloylglycine hydrolase family protein [Pirellulales bacterium]|nr:choloylglycine hydrolase family protein [Pirellulales bacterium]